MPADYDGDYMIEIDEPSVESRYDSHQMSFDWARQALSFVRVAVCWGRRRTAAQTARGRPAGTGGAADDETGRQQTGSGASAGSLRRLFSRRATAAEPRLTSGAAIVVSLGSTSVPRRCCRSR